MKQTEIGLIPDDWEVNLIGNVSEIFGRIGFRGYTVEDLVDEGFGAITLSPSNIQNGKMDFSNCSYISWKKYDESPEIKIANGDILLVKTGSTYGKSAIVKNLAKKATINPQFVVIKKTKCNNELLGYLIQTPIVQEQIEASIVGGAIPTLSQKQIASFKIPLSKSIKEQQRIAKALSDVDSVISTTEKLLQKKKNIKQGTMQELLTGKKRLPGFAKSTNTKMTELGEIPEDWEVKSVSSLLKIGHGKDYKNLKEGAVPVFGTGGYMTSVNDYLYDGDTVCIGRKGTIDKPFFHTGKIWTVDTLFYTYDFVNCIPKFIYYAFCLVDWLSMNEASGVPSLTSKNIEDVFLCIPSNVSEQTAIVNVLSDMDAEIEKLSAKLQKYHQLKTAMMQQLLTGKIRLV